VIAGGTKPCICCGGREEREWLPGLRQCRRCRHIRASLELSRKEYEALYSSAYFRGGEYADYEAERSALRRNFGDRLGELRQRLPRGARIWEVGCAYGFFLEMASAYFDAAGCDISRDAVAYATENLHVEAYCMDYLEAHPPAGYDAVCMWDTIEHLPAPDRYIARAAADLKTDGILMISTGDAASWNARLRGRRWRLIHPPTHLHYFTPDSIARLLERKGFHDIQVRHHAFWRHTDTAARKLLQPENRVMGARLYAMLNRMKLLNGCFPLNLGDLMTVTAVKR
jgi:2-polyprenyl-3-methyl-5-hydroxy-6-metoxy-1,4-benzoquinol methylase